MNLYLIKFDEESHYVAAETMLAAIALFKARYSEGNDPESITYLDEVLISPKPGLKNGHLNR